MSKDLTLFISVAIAIIAAFIGLALYWIVRGNVMSMHGWIAVALGCSFSIALSGGLFWLTFKSAREGYDEIDRPEDYGE